MEQDVQYYYYNESLKLTRNTIVDVLVLSKKRLMKKD